MQMLNLERTVCLWVFNILLIGFSVHGQEFSPIKKVTDDTIQIKWLPSNYFALRQMVEGATVSRIETTSSTGLKSLNYSNGEIWTIGPLKERVDRLDLNDSLESSYALLFDPVLNWASEEDARNFAFGTNVIMNITDPNVQAVMQNFIVDTSFDPSKTYAYKIEVKGVKPAYIFVDPKEKTLTKDVKLSLELDAKKTVVCHWNRDELMEVSFAYDIFHSVSDTTDSNLLLDNPFFPFTTELHKEGFAEVRHDEPEQGVWHFYKVVGRDAFGVPFYYSDWQSIYVPERLESYPTIDSVKSVDTRRIVHVSIQSSGKNRVNFAALFRSTDRESDYKMIEVQTYSGDSLLTFESKVDKPTGDSYYYKVGLFGKDDTVYSVPKYFFTLDQQPPSAPSRLTVEIDSAGIATINWNAPKDTDLKGYRVFRANQTSEEFIERTTNLRLLTEYKDTLALDNLTSQVYYFVKAVDQNYNQSASSDTVLALKPDTIPPTAAIIKSVRLENKSIRVEWIESGSEDADSTVLFRNSVRVGILDSVYIDTLLTAGSHYLYHLVTYDHAGNKAVSKAIGQKYEPGTREAIELSGIVNAEKHRIELTWTTNDKDIYSFKIYKATAQGKLRLWKTIKDATVNQITDTSVLLGEQYTYSLIYLTSEGIASEPSEITLNY